MKYKLINKKTGEEHNCSKVIVGIYEYYVSNDIKGREGLNFNFGLNRLDTLPHSYESYSAEWQFCRKVIAVNRDSLNLPQVIDESIELAKNHGNIFSSEGGHRNYAMQGYLEGYNKSKETNPFSLQDMVDFSLWVADTKKHGYAKQLYEAMIVNRVSTTEELIQIWQAQQTKTVYYQ